MPSRTNRRERDIIEVFLNGYDDGRWSDSGRDWLDERVDGSVEVIATNVGGETLAIEHTLVEIFIGDKLDAKRHKGFLDLRDDPELVVFGKMIAIQVPRDTLTPGFDWQPVIDECRNWLKSELPSFPDGDSDQNCPVSETRIAGNQIPLKARVLETPGKQGRLFISRYGDADTAQSVERALARKLPKLAKTNAHRRILMFERNQMKQGEESMFETVESLRPKYPQIEAVDEWWCVETIGYEEDKPLNERVLFFSQFQRSRRIKTMMFYNGRYSE